MTADFAQKWWDNGTRCPVCGCATRVRVYGYDEVSDGSRVGDPDGDVLVCVAGHEFGRWVTNRGG